MGDEGMGVAISFTPMVSAKPQTRNQTKNDQKVLVLKKPHRLRPLFRYSSAIRNPPWRQALLSGLQWRQLVWLGEKVYGVCTVVEQERND